MSQSLTFLCPTDPTTNQVTKTYQKQADGSIQRISDYNLGYLFNVSVETLDQLPELVPLFRKYRQTHVLIFGRPEPDIVPPVQRLKQHFPEAPEGYTLQKMDIDGWPVTPAQQQAAGWRFSDPKTTESIVRMLLINAGLDWLANVDIVVLLSASMFDYSELRAHVYWLFRRPVTLDEMRHVALAANKGQTTKVFDHQVYKSVQPDFISTPVCDNFRDPIPERLYYFPSPFGLTHVEPDVWTAYKKTLENRVGYTISPASTAPKLGSNWIETLRVHAGTTEMGINEPAYRAASQLVQELGLAEILGNMEKYVTLFYNTLWQMVDERGLRGGKDDRLKYDKQKIRSYLKSACDKNFGSENDKLMQRVNDAIDAAVKGNMQPIYSSHCLYAAAKLKASSVGMYATLRARVKKELRGYVQLGEWESAMRNAYSGPVDDYKALLPDPGGSNQDAIGAASTVTLGLQNAKTTAENRLMIRMMRDFDIIRDQEGVWHLLSTIRKNGIDRYAIYPMTNELSELLFYKAQTLTNGEVSADFGKKCMAFVRGAIDAEDDLFNRKEGVLVGDRVAQAGSSPTADCWLNLGDCDGRDPETIRIGTDGIEWVPLEKCPILFRQGFDRMSILSDEEYQHRFNGDPETLIRFYYDNLGRFIPSTMEARVHVTAWAVTALTNRPMPYIAELVGPKQSGKSTSAGFMKDLVDPDEAANPEEGRGLNRFSAPNSDFFNHVYKQHVTIIDNISSLNAEAQDAFCQLATGLAFNERILYSHKQRRLFIKRPIIITSIDEVITREDLASRALTIHFSTLKRSNLGLFEQWRDHVPIFRRALLEIVHQTMKRYAALTDADVAGANPRDIVYSIVHKILTPDSKKTIRQLSSELNTVRSLASATSDGAMLQFIAFMQEKGNITSNTWVSPTDLSINFNRWIRNNYGIEKTIFLGSSRGSVITTASVSIDHTKVLDTPKKVGRFLSRNLETLNRMSGWTISEINTARKMKERLFVENISLTKIL